MKIGEEIRQEKFRDEYHKLIINLLYTANWLTYKNASILKPFGISPEQFNVLRILRGQYPNSATVNLIIERMLDKSSNASRLVEKLRVKGLVEREICPEDRRAVNVKITPEGLNLLAELDKKEEQWRSEFHHLSIDEAAIVNDLLDKIRG